MQTNDKFGERPADGPTDLVGRSVPFVDAWEKVTGEAMYFSDLKLPGMLHGKVVRSPIPHGKILNIDVHKAQAIPGVKAVVTAEDTPQILYGVQVSDELILASEKVRFIGDEIAAVAAVDEDTAEEAVQAIAIEYQELPAVFDPEEALREAAPLIHEVPQNIAAESHIVRGEVDRLFEEADHVFADTFYTSQVTPGYLEPFCCLARWHGDKLDAWIPTQAPFLTRAVLARSLGLPASSVRVLH
jgi:CO/xanthine dehydrogenase Mo-binding subunit